MKTTAIAKMMLTGLVATSLWANGPMAPATGGSTGSKTPKANPPSTTSRAPQSGRSGITVCYDYAYHCGTGRLPQGRYLGADDLRRDPSVRSRVTYKDPAMARYQPGDWVLTSSGHAGYVNSRGRIDHFLQVPGRIGELYPNVEALPPHVQGGQLGGLHKNHTTEEFLSSGFRRQPGVTVEVLRRR